MVDVNDDPEYTQLKSHVKGRELAREIWSALGTVAVATAIACPLLLPLAATGAIAAAAWWTIGAAGLVAAFSAWKAFRADQDVRFDTEELKSRREAANLGRVLNNARSPNPEVAVAATMARADGKSWTDTVQMPEGTSLERH